MKFVLLCAAGLLLSGCGGSPREGRTDTPQDMGDSSQAADETDVQTIRLDPSGFIHANGLYWMVGPDLDLNWDQANEWAGYLNERAGYLGGGWRMPSISELKGLWNAGVNKDNWGPFRISGVLVWSGDHNVFCFFSGDVFPYPRQTIAVGTRAFAVRSPD